MTNDLLYSDYSSLPAFASSDFSSDDNFTRRQLEQGTVLSLLRGYELALTVEEALTYLENLDNAFGILYLYERLFPSEFAVSFTPPLPAEHEVYSPRELEFFNLVNDRLFPFQIEALEDENFNGGPREKLIWIWNMGLDFWSDDPSELPEGWKIMLVICGQVAPEAVFFGERFEQYKGIFETIISGTVGWLELVWLCQHHSNPQLLELIPALEIIDHATDNIWLDYDDENPYTEANWCEEDVSELARQYGEADAILAKVNIFLEWLSQDVANVKEVIHLWNLAVGSPIVAPQTTLETAQTLLTAEPSQQQR